MTLRARTFSAPKSGHTAEEYEDAAAGPAAAPDGTTRLALADGATESAFAGLWAQTLVASFVAPESAVPETFGEFLHRARRAFGEAIAEREAGLSWYASAKAEEGAHAAFLGLVLYPDFAWRAVAVGDCCLLHFRDGARLEAWPISDPTAFGHRPDLVTSRYEDSHAPITTSGQWAGDDRLILASDALAAYLLALDAIPEDFGDFDAFVAGAREAGMRNDDVTLVEVVLG